MAQCGEQFLFIEIELRRHMPTAGADELDAVILASLGVALSLWLNG